MEENTKTYAIIAETKANKFKVVANNLNVITARNTLKKAQSLVAMHNMNNIERVFIYNLKEYEE
jgi:hypothetical protein